MKTPKSTILTLAHDFLFMTLDKSAFLYTDHADFSIFQGKVFCPTREIRILKAVNFDFEKANIY
jgi:hypothetical protein